MNPNNRYLSDEIQVYVDDDGDVQVSLPDDVPRRPAGFTRAEELALDHPGISRDE